MPAVPSRRPSLTSALQVSATTHAEPWPHASSVHAQRKSSVPQKTLRSFIFALKFHVSDRKREQSKPAFCLGNRAGLSGNWPKTFASFCMSLIMTYSSTRHFSVQKHLVAIRFSRSPFTGNSLCSYYGDNGAACILLRFVLFSTHLNQPAEHFLRY